MLQHALALRPEQTALLTCVMPRHRSTRPLHSRPIRRQGCAGSCRGTLHARLYRPGCCSGSFDIGFLRIILGLPQKGIPLYIVCQKMDSTRSAPSVEAGLVISLKIDGDPAGKTFQP